MVDKPSVYDCLGVAVGEDRKAKNSCRVLRGCCCERHLNGVEVVENASERLDDARRTGTSEGIRQLQQRAEQLGEQQDAIAQGVQGLGGAGAAERQEQLRRLNQRKDALANEIDRLQSDVERAARESRRDQPKSAQALESAAGTMREGRLADRVRFSRGVAANGSPEYARAMRIASSFASLPEFTK